MKTAISLPDDVFEACESVAMTLGVSRSELYVTALREFLVSRSEESVTDVLNQVHSGTTSLDSDLAHSQSALLAQEEW